MLQRLHPEAELLRQADEREELVRAIAVRGDEQFLAQNVEDRLHAQVAPRGQSLPGLFPSLPLTLVVARGHEVIADDLLRSHAGVGVASLAPFRVLAQSELHRARRVLQLEILGQRAPAHLHEDVLAPDGVGGTVLDVCGGEPAGHLPVHPDVVVGDDVAHPHLGDDREAALVHGAHTRVDVRVDQSRRDVLPRAVDLDRAARGIEVHADRFDRPGANQQVGAFHHALRAHGPDGRVPHQDRGGLLRHRASAVVHHRPDERQVDLGHVHRHGPALRTLKALRAGAAEGRVRPVRQRSPSVELVVAHGARQERQALIAEHFAVEARIDPPGLRDSPGRCEVDPGAAGKLRAGAGYVEVAAQPVQRTLEHQDGVEAPLVIRSDLPGPPGIDLDRTGHAVHPSPNPDITDRGLLGQQVTLRDDQVGHLALGDGPVRAIDSEPGGGCRGERGQSVVRREPPRDRDAQIGQKLVERREAVGGDGEADPGIRQLRRAGRRQVPVAKVGERGVERRPRIADVGGVREVQGHDQGFAPVPEHIDDPVLLAVAAVPRLEPELRRQGVGPEVLPLPRRSRRRPADRPQRHPPAPRGPRSSPEGGRRARSIRRRPTRACTNPRP